MRSALPMRTVQGTVPHVWVDFFVYTYKFTFDWCIITTQMSFLYAPTTSACRTSPTTSDHFRRLPTSELLRGLPTISDDFRFPNHCSPTEPIRGLPNNTPHLHDSRDQTNPQCCSHTPGNFIIFLSKMPAKQQCLAGKSSEFRDRFSVHYRQFSCAFACY